MKKYFIICLIGLSVNVEVLAARKVAAKKNLHRKVSLKKTKKRNIASVAHEMPTTSVTIFNEYTNYEEMIYKRAEAARNPASLVPKARVISVRRELALNDEERPLPQDYILNVGASGGMSEGMTLTVARKIPILDPYQGNQQKELTVPFAVIKIIHSDKDLSVARLVKFDTAMKVPGVYNRAVMVGDYVGNVED